MYKFKILKGMQDNMNILLIIPKYDYNHLSKERNYHYVFPIGLGYISSVLKKEKYNVDCLNLNHLDGLVEDLIEKKSPQLCCGWVKPIY